MKNKNQITSYMILSPLCAYIAKQQSKYNINVSPEEITHWSIKTTQAINNMTDRQTDNKKHLSKKITNNMTRKKYSSLFPFTPEENNKFVSKLTRVIYSKINGKCKSGFNFEKTLIPFKNIKSMEQSNIAKQCDKMARNLQKKYKIKKPLMANILKENCYQDFKTKQISTYNLLSPSKNQGLLSHSKNTLRQEIKEFYELYSTLHLRNKPKKAKAA